MELAVALLWLGSYAVFGLSWTAAVLGVMAVVTVALVTIDIRYSRLPHRIVLPTYGIVAPLMIIAWLVGERETWLMAGAGCLLMGGLYGVLWFIYPKGMGFGDVTTAGLLGLVGGFLGVQHLAVAAIAGPLVGGLVVLGLLGARKLTRGQAVPYGPALIAGAWIGYLGGPAIASGYLDLMGL